MSDPKPVGYPGTQKQWDVENEVLGTMCHFHMIGPAHNPDQYKGKVYLDGDFTAADLRRILDALENP